MNLKQVNYFGILLSVPVEAQYIAMDGNGHLYWYSDEPGWNINNNFKWVSTNLIKRIYTTHEQREVLQSIKPELSLRFYKDTEIKTVNYFGVNLVVPKAAKYIAMDGKEKEKRLFWYIQEPEWNSERKVWSFDSKFGDIESDDPTLEILFKALKPKHSLVEFRVDF